MGDIEEVAPQETTGPTVAVVVLSIAILLEGWSFRTAFVAASEQKEQLTWWQFIRRTKTPELPVVLLEDLGALFGLTFALIGISLSVATGDTRFDALGSIAIGSLLGVIAVVLAIEMKSLLIGEAASLADQQEIQRAVLDVENLRRVIHMRTQHLGPNELLVAAKVELVDELSISAVAAAINEAERNIRERVPAATIIYIEPDIYRPGAAEVQPST